MQGLQEIQNLAQIRPPDIASIDDAGGKHFVRWQVVGDESQLSRRPYSVQMQSIHGKPGRQMQVVLQGAKIGRQEQLHRCCVQAAVGAFIGLLPVRGQIQRQGRFIQLHPFHAQVGQTLQNVAIGCYQVVQEFEAVEGFPLGLAQP